jgi:hypothetical protein
LIGVEVNEVDLAVLPSALFDLAGRACDGDCIICPAALATDPGGGGCDGGCDGPGYDPGVICGGCDWGHVPCDPQLAGPCAADILDRLPGVSAAH